MSITVEKTLGEDSVVLDFHDAETSSGHMIRITNVEYDVLINTVLSQGVVPDYECSTCEPTDLELQLTEWENDLIRDEELFDMEDRFAKAEAELSQERHLVRRLVGIIDSLSEKVGT